MPCCGNAKRQLTTDVHAHPGAVRVTDAMLRAARFRYAGKTRLTAVGAVTRTLYRFDAPGAQAIVDGRDVPSIAGIPMLVRV